MVQIGGMGGYDFSIVASLNCNLRCPHCQYCAGPDETEWLDESILNRLLGTVDWDEINSIGFYGGEISVNLERWAAYVRAIGDRSPCWCITNGSWSRSRHAYDQMIDFASRFGLTVFISTTPWHKDHQDVDRLQHLVRNSTRFGFKKDDTKSRLLPMGRNRHDNWGCTRRCEETTGDPERLAILPNADIIYQSCDGVYPKITNVARKDAAWLNVKRALRNFRCPRLCTGCEN